MLLKTNITYVGTCRQKLSLCAQLVTSEAALVEEAACAQHRAAARAEAGGHGAARGMLEQHRSEAEAEWAHTSLHPPTSTRVRGGFEAGVFPTAVQ